MREHRVVRVHALCSELGVSAATVRRDLEILEEQGQVRRVHGGAVSVDSMLDEPLFDDKASLSTKEKFAIARKALDYIQPDDTIFLDGGSTVLGLAHLLRDRSNLTVVTNSLRAAQELSGHGPRLLLIGGELRRRSQTLVGPMARHLLEEVYLDKAFMGTIGLSLENGLTTTDPNEAYPKQLVLEHAREVILLADSSKYGKVSFAKAGRLDQVQVLITDAALPRKAVNDLRKRGIRVVRA